MYRLINYLFWILSAALILAVAPAGAQEVKEFYPVTHGSAHIDGASPSVHLGSPIICSHTAVCELACLDYITRRGLFEYDLTTIPSNDIITKAYIFIQYDNSSAPLPPVEFLTYSGQDGFITLAEARQDYKATLFETITTSEEWATAQRGIDITENIAPLFADGERYPGVLMKLENETLFNNTFAQIIEPDPLKGIYSLKLIILHQSPDPITLPECILEYDCKICCNNSFVNSLPEPELGQLIDCEIDCDNQAMIHMLCEQSCYDEAAACIDECDLFSGCPGCGDNVECVLAFVENCSQAHMSCLETCPPRLEPGYLQTCSAWCIVDAGCLVSEQCSDSCSDTISCDVSLLCGNGMLQFPEHCDDNNTLDGDNCTSTCEAVTTDPVNIVIDDNGDGTYDYIFQNPLDNQTTTEIFANDGLIDLIGFDYRYDGNQTDGVVGLSTKNLPLASTTTRSIILPWQLNFCAVDEELFVAGSFDWNLCSSHPNRIIWSPQSPFNNGCDSSPKSARDKDLVLQPDYTCEVFFDDGNVYARLNGFTHTTVIGANEVQCIYTGDSDHDGICDDVDNCKDTCNPSQLDADGDGIGDLCDNPQESGCGGGSSCAGSEPDCEVACIVDSDNDGVPDAEDNCPELANSGQEDTDSDDIGDVCDACTDTDNDGYGNLGYPNNTCPDDNCPDKCNELQLDADGDNVGDVCDLDPGCGGCGASCEVEC